MAEERKFKTLVDFIQGCHELSEEDYAIELKKFSATERANIAATEYIAAIHYPAGKVNREDFKLTMKVKGKLYYPIVGWDPDAASPAVEGIKIPVMRKYLNRLPKRYLHNPRENKTYILYG